ncbi:MAG: trehalose-phosphatase [Oleiphilaceae bacterium]|nr:trehalose-phosphatase [Oleiphilaceae bacterium]
MTLARDHQLSPGLYDGVALDLDGVITSTAQTHAQAWKAVFDELLSRQGSEKPFDIDRDYRQFVDGKPRYEGVLSFLESRGIDLPWGNTSDSPGFDTVCAIGNRKNQLFQDLLKKGGVEVFPSSLSFIRQAREAGLAVGVASSSRNCKAVLKAGGIEDLFDARVDGGDLEQLGLAGKPEPDMFLETARRLASDPGRTVGIEDAASGIVALKKAGFGLVIGVSRGDGAEDLRRCGADLVVADLSELSLSHETSASVADSVQLPSALDHLDEILSDQQREVAVFLDYDGTLTPIVDHPDHAILSDSMRATLNRLSGLCEVAVLSGRNLDDVREKVAIPRLWYAGSHGFDIAGPEGQRHQHEDSQRFLESLDQVEQQARRRLAAIEGCLVERKRFSLAIHYRQVAPAEVPEVQAVTDELLKARDDLRLTAGKKIFELRPDIEWDKGYALNWLMQSRGLHRDRFKPLYIGDDLTDEDAFREIANDGVGILVAPEVSSTRAAYQLQDTDAVEAFLDALGAYFERIRS